MGERVALEITGERREKKEREEVMTWPGDVHPDDRLMAQKQLGTLKQ